MYNFLVDKKVHVANFWSLKIVVSNLFEPKNGFFRNMYVEKPVTTIFVNTFWEKPEIVHHFTLDQIYFQKATPQAGFLLTLGIADFSANKVF
jgi:hypothetical protein